MYLGGPGLVRAAIADRGRDDDQRGAVGYGLYWLGKTYELEFLSNTVILVAAFIVLIIVYVIFKFAEDLLDMGGVVLGFRPLQFLMGLVALGEAALLLAGYSIWHFLA